MVSKLNLHKMQSLIRMRNIFLSVVTQKDGSQIKRCGGSVRTNQEAWTLLKLHSSLPLTISISFTDCHSDYVMRSRNTQCWKPEPDLSCSTKPPQLPTSQPWKGQRLLLTGATQNRGRRQKGGPGDRKPRVSAHGCGVGILQHEVFWRWTTWLITQPRGRTAQSLGTLKKLSWLTSCFMLYYN